MSGVDGGSHRPLGRWLSHLSEHARGLMLTTVGVVVLSPDSLLVRAVDADQWTILFWRGVLVTAGLGAGLLAFARLTRRRLDPVGRVGAVVAVSWAVTTILFVTAITHTGVANTLVIVSAAPLFTAALSRVVLAEAVAPRTWVAVVLVLGGMGIIFGGSLEGGQLLGDLAALGGSVGIAISFVAIRRGRAVSMLPAIVMGSLLTALAALPLAEPASVGWNDFGILVLNAFVLLPISASLVVTGPRYLPAPEVKLLGLIETVLGPLWVWWILAEAPSLRALLAGAVILPTLAAHSVLALRSQRRTSTAVPRGEPPGRI